MTDPATPLQSLPIVATTYRFGPFVADRTTYRVVEDGQPLELTPKLLDLLFHFLERPAALVTKEALLADVWRDANVTDNALAQAISDLREALGDRASEPTYILTVARRGYRFVAPVVLETPRAAAATAPARAAAAASAVERPTSPIAVLDFVNVTGDSEIGWLASGIAETVTSDLASLGRFQVVDRWRVMQASGGDPVSVQQLATTLGLSHAVVGSFQRQGQTLRITARLLDVTRGTTVADAKVDGPLASAFALQDAIVTTFARGLGLGTDARAARPRGRETSSLEAYRACTEGWLKIESLDTDLVPDAVRDFERAITLDPHYVVAHTGLANAEYVAYEMSRATSAPNTGALAAGIAHARHAVSIDPTLGEAHATLSFLLVSSGEMAEARAAAQVAVAIEPDNWRHQFRLGHAVWGEGRLDALRRALVVYPEFAYARFEMAMVFVARGDLKQAAELANQGITEQDRQSPSGHRFPAIGFHWLLGAIEAARGRTAEAIAQFDRELAHVDARRLYGSEYGAMTSVARGHALVASDRADEALGAFRQAQAYMPHYPYASLGERSLTGRPPVSDGLHPPARSGSDRSFGSIHLSACELAVGGRTAEALEVLERGLETGPPSFLGWTIPIEPAFYVLRGNPRFARVLEIVAERAS
jgi:DNA-binding winged helix-turn-helix (wHTH) protein